MPTSDPLDLMTIPEVADLLHVSHNTVRRFIAEGSLPASQLRGRGGPIRIQRADAEALLRPIEVTGGGVA